MKVIFLDHDGVICLATEWGGRERKRKGKTAEDLAADPTLRFDNFNPKAVKVLNRIIEAVDAEIVISSDWRLHATLSEMQELYRKYGVVKAPIAYTPNLRDIDPELAGLCYWKGWLEKARATEIKAWLANMHPQVTHWVAVDDLDMSANINRGDAEWGLSNFVLCPSGTEGIKQTGLEVKIKNFLA